LVLTFAALVAAPAAAFEPAAPLVWHRDYQLAYQDAKASKKMLLIFFQSTRHGDMTRSVEDMMLRNREVSARLNRYVLAKLPLNAEVLDGDKRVKLINHGAFQEMQGREGLAVVDLAHEGTP